MTFQAGFEYIIEDFALGLIVSANFINLRAYFCCRQK